MDDTNSSLALKVIGDGIEICCYLSSRAVKKAQKTVPMAPS